jgi:hypothetical protein
MHPKDEDAYKPQTIVSLKKTHEFARIIEPVFLKDCKGFLHYHAEIEGRDGMWALYHDDIILECLPPEPF